jgi:hypothetical protein
MDLVQNQTWYLCITMYLGIRNRCYHFFLKKFIFNNYKSRSSESFTVFAHAAEAHGKWDGRQPFISCLLALDKPVMVLTRASIRLSKFNFEWSSEQKFRDYDGLASIGVGEWPLIQQATLSIWKRRND